MSLLDITNLTDNPTKWIEDKYLDAFEEVEKELNKSITNENKRDFILNQIEYLEETMEEAKGNELLGIIDNYLVNLDYYSVVREWYQDNK